MSDPQKSEAFQRIGILGAGAWGTALALTAHRAGREVCLWAREPEVVTTIQTTQENRLFLPGIHLPPELSVTNDHSHLLACDLILSVLPAQYTANMLAALAPQWPQDLPIVIASKGIEIATGDFLSDVVARTLPGRPYAILSGPTFAIDTAQNHPTAVTIAAADGPLAQAIISALGHDRFRPYASRDPMGVQIGGALKNVIAIACGMVSGLGLGENARAALMTRGLAEINRFAQAHGADPATLMGLSGMGDLVLTCASATSRNMSLGQALGEGRSLSEILGERTSIAEGVPTAEAVWHQAQALNIEMPICTATHIILTGQMGLATTVKELLSRPLKFETD